MLDRYVKLMFKPIKIYLNLPHKIQHRIHHDEKLLNTNITKKQRKKVIKKFEMYMLDVLNIPTTLHHVITGFIENYNFYSIIFETVLHDDDLVKRFEIYIETMKECEPFIIKWYNQQENIDILADNPENWNKIIPIVKDGIPQAKEIEIKLNKYKQKIKDANLEFHT